MANWFILMFYFLDIIKSEEVENRRRWVTNNGMNASYQSIESTPVVLPPVIYYVSFYSGSRLNLSTENVGESTLVHFEGCVFYVICSKSVKVNQD